jgi:hypothetical protein
MEEICLAQHGLVQRSPLKIGLLQIGAPKVDLGEVQVGKVRPIFLAQEEECLGEPGRLRMLLASRGELRLVFPAQQEDRKARLARLSGLWSFPSVRSRRDLCGSVVG